MSMRNTRVAAWAAAAVLLGAAFTAVPAQAANVVSTPSHVKGSCSGRILSTEKIGTGSQGAGSQVGHIQIWYSSADGGTNCVMVYTDIGSATISATLQPGTTGNSSTAKIAATYRDVGNYHSYAGGVYATHLNGKCISWYGEIKKNGHTYGNGSWSWMYCG